MAENNIDEDKQKTLTLSSSKLSVKKTVDSEKLRQSYIAKRGVSPSKRGMDDILQHGLTKFEISTRLKVLEKASAQDLRQETEFGLTQEDDRRNGIKGAVVPPLREPVQNIKEEVIINVGNDEKKLDELKERKKVHQIVEVVEDKKKKHKSLKQDIGSKFKKNQVHHLLDEGGGSKIRSLTSLKRAREKEKRKFEQTIKSKIYRDVLIPAHITVSELASRMSERATDVIKELMKLGLMVTINQSVEADVAELVVSSLGHKPHRVKEENMDVLHEDLGGGELLPRIPVVTVMGHVDHGKTTLLDALRSSSMAVSEHGGITQHIGAYRVTFEGKHITFIDTPGHEAFSAMRGRGAKVTDIVILVVAADDGVRPQTIEAINHAKAAGVPIIVAINKIDKYEANVEKVRQELLTHELIPEELGGDVIVVPISATKMINFDKLLEAVLLVAEMQDIKANYNVAARGVVIEVKSDRTKGIVVTLLMQHGVLQEGNVITAGVSFGKIKKMLDDGGLEIKEALPGMPVVVLGFDKSPQAGDKFIVVQNEKQAREIVESYEEKLKEQHGPIIYTTEELFVKMRDKPKDLLFIIKADTSGSVGAIVSSLNKISNSTVSVKVIHTGVGGISESDITLAKATNSIVIGFHVKATQNAAALALKEKVDVRYYSIIYDLIDDITAIVSGMVEPIKREEHLGTAEIRQIFNITGVGKVAGCYITKGVVKRGSLAQIVRDSIIIHQTVIRTLRRGKDDAKEVKEGFECGIYLEGYGDIKVGDIIEVSEIVTQKL